MKRKGSVSDAAKRSRETKSNCGSFKRAEKKMSRDTRKKKNEKTKRKRKKKEKEKTEQLERMKKEVQGDKGIS